MSNSNMTNWETFEKFSNEVTDNNILLNSGCVFCFIIVSSRCPRTGYSDTPRDGADFVSHKREVLDIIYERVREIHGSYA